MRGQAHARVRIGTHDIAVPAGAVMAALPPDAATSALPRRGSPVVGACETAWGMVPVVDLARWMDLGESTNGERAGNILVLQEEGRRLAVRADALHGVARALSQERLVHDEDPDELFHSAVRWEDGTRASAVLEVRRLAELALTWVAQPPTFSASGPEAALGGTAAGTTAHAVVGAGGTWWALPAAQVTQVVPALPLEMTLSGVGATRGFCTWQGAKLPVLDLGLMDGRPPAAGTWMALVVDGERAAAVLVDAVRKVLPLVPAGNVQAVPVLVPGLGEVIPIDVVSLLERLPESRMAGPLGHSAGTAAPAHREFAGAAAYVLFEHDATYATPADRVLQAIALDERQGQAVAAGTPVHLSWRGHLVPVHALPCYGGGAKPALPRVALVVDMPAGQGPVALAVTRLQSWEAAGKVAPLRVPAMGTMAMLTIGEGGSSSSHLVIDLAEVAYALA